MPRAETAGRAARDVAADLDDDLKCRAHGEREEEHAQEIASEEAADPPAQNRRPAGDEREYGEPRAAHGRSACNRCSDAESFGDVVDHEANDQEGSERELTQCDRGADREALA